VEVRIGNSQSPRLPGSLDHEAVYYRGSKEYEGLKLEQATRLKEPEHENAK
jgi:hypothetical protein